MAPRSADEIRNDYPPEDPTAWSRARAGEERLNRATGLAAGGRAGEKRRRRGNRSTYVAILILLAILVGGGYFAHVRGWIDLADLPAIPGLPSIAGITGGGGASPPRVDRAKLVFSGNAGELASPAGNLVQQDQADPAITWIRSSLREAVTTGATDGASLEVKPPLAGDLVGRRIRLTISARAPDQGTPAPFAVAYSAGDAGSSGWVVFTPSTEFDDYSFDYQVPATVGTAQHVGIWSDISGRGAPLAVSRITIEPLN